MNAETKPTAVAHAVTTDAIADTGLLDAILQKVDAIAAQQSRPSPVRLTSWQDIERFAEKAARSNMVPTAYKGKPDDIVIAVQMGSELGLAPMQALQNIAAINGRPAVFGDAMPGLCRASGKCDYIKEWMDGDTAFCEAKRRDDPNIIKASFSMADAKRASLTGKPGPWTSYPTRMLQMRARGFALRDAFPDVLRGLISAEEAADIPLEATGLNVPKPAQIEPEPAPEPTLAPPKRTWATLIGEIEADLQHATSRDAIDAIISEDRVQNAIDKAPGQARDRINAVVSAALARFPDSMTDDVEFPGDK
jgi:hypothetical protein